MGCTHPRASDRPDLHQVGAFQSQPFPTPTEPYTQGGHSGGNWTFKGTTGASIPVEISYTPLIGEEQMPGH